MIITQKDLIKKTKNPDLLYDLNNYFPAGFDFSGNYTIPSYVLYSIFDYATLFSYTGVFTSTLSGSRTNRLALSCKINFKNGDINDFSDGSPGYTTYSSNGPAEIGFYKNGKLDNPGFGKPARMYFFINTNLLCSREFYTNGKSNDPKVGIPAFLSYYINGNISKKQFKTNGETQNPDPFTPAFSWYRETGELQVIGYYTDGKFKDPISGEAADQSFNIDGTIRRQAHYA